MNGWALTVHARQQQIIQGVHDLCFHGDILSAHKEIQPCMKHTCIQQAHIHLHIYGSVCACGCDKASWINRCGHQKLTPWQNKFWAAGVTGHLHITSSMIQPACPSRVLKVFRRNDVTLTRILTYVEIVVKHFFQGQLWGSVIKYEKTHKLLLRVEEAPQWEPNLLWIWSLINSIFWSTLHIFC